MVAPEVLKPRGWHTQLVRSAGAEPAGRFRADCGCNEILPSGHRSLISHMLALSAQLSQEAASSLCVIRQWLTAALQVSDGTLSVLCLEVL